MLKISQSKLIVVFFLAIWATTLSVNLTRFKEPNLLTAIPLFTSVDFKMTLPGVDIVRFENLLMESSTLCSSLRSLGYEIKARLNQIPDYIFFSKSSVKPEQKQLALREEVVDEFDSPQHISLYQDQLNTVREQTQRFKRDHQSDIAVMIVPTKIFANQMDVTLWDIALGDFKKMGLTLTSKRVGSEFNQKRTEQMAKQLGVKLISILNDYRSLQTDKSLYPLYPYGESHWSKPLLVLIAPSILRQALAHLNLPPKCFNSSTDLPSLRGSVSSLLSGDMISALQLSPERDLSKHLSTPIVDLHWQTLTHSIAYNKECPTLYYVGTSYGNSYEGNGDITQALNLFYRGEVQNHSESGKGGLQPLLDFESKGVPQKSKIIWEFPFRYLKKLTEKNKVAW